MGVPLFDRSGERSVSLSMKKSGDSTFRAALSVKIRAGAWHQRYVDLDAAVAPTFGTACYLSVLYQTFLCALPRHSSYWRWRGAFAGEENRRSVLSR